jgi:predicted Rossmann fold nucleotide-binding protein DprA/Smf involved in DNA uptake
MKLLITGSRRATAQDYARLAAAIQKYAPQATEILHGGAIGADQLADQYAQAQGLPVTVIRPDYAQWPAKVAPLKRNHQLVDLADGVIALYKDKRKGGTAYTAKLAQEAGKLLVELHDGGELKPAGQLSMPL